MSAEFGLPEWVSLFFFSFFSILAWLRPLDWKSRLNATWLGAVAIMLLVVTSLNIVREVVTLRPILPLLLMPMAYWQTGQFTAPLNDRLQTALAAMDRRILAPFEGFSLPSWLERPVHVYLEFAYLLVYPMVPSALTVLYLAGAGEHAGEFWTVVLPPAYLCYATLPFLRTLPPRSLERPREIKAPQVGIRGFNLIVVRHVTHQANTFPSGHAAAAMAVALELLLFVPAAGMVYLVLAISIMAAAFIGRYHYAADVVLGGALAFASFLTLAR
jgi:membrane-associated phospholipid phosphatase